MKEAAVEFFRSNMVVVQFAHGLAFFAMGLAVALQARRPSELAMARHLPLLGVFGILQALASWGEVFIPIQRTYSAPPVVITLQALHALLTALTFSFLMAFGAHLLADREARLRPLRYLPAALTAVWAISFFLYPVLVLPNRYEQWLVVSEAWSRYILALPGAVLVAAGLAVQVDQLRRSGMGRLVRRLEWAIFAFSAYAVAAGVIVPDAGFAPSTVLNAERFLWATGLPVEVVRALAGIGMATFMIRVLEVFDIEAMQRVEENKRMRAILEERDRIARELHDGVIQSLYALGLGMENVMYAGAGDPGRTRRALGELLGRVNDIIQDVRGYIMDLRLPGQANLTLVQKIQAVAGEASRVYHLPVELDLGRFDEERLHPGVANELSQVVKEAVSNAARHGSPRRIQVGVHEVDGELVVYVQDDGRGFDPARSEGRQGFGLANMRRRAELLGGEFDIDSRPGEGTTVIVRIPFQRATEPVPAGSRQASA